MQEWKFTGRDESFIFVAVLVPDRSSLYNFWLWKLQWGSTRDGWSAGSFSANWSVLASRSIFYVEAPIESQSFFSVLESKVLFTKIRSVSRSTCQRVVSLKDIYHRRYRLQAAWPPSEFIIEIWNGPVGRNIQSWCAPLEDWVIFRLITNDSCEEICNWTISYSSLNIAIFAMYVIQVQTPFLGWSPQAKLGLTHGHRRPVSMEHRLYRRTDVGCDASGHEANLSRGGGAQQVTTKYYF